MIATKQSPKDF